MFGTSGIRGPVGETVTAGLAVEVGRAVAAGGAATVVVGRDARTSGPLLTDALTAGLRECGADVRDLGVASTPAVARATGWENADAGVAVTASHNPPEDNGLKLWNPSGQAFDEAQRRAVERRVEDGVSLAAWDELGERTAVSDAADRHADALRGAVDVDGDLSVVVDAGNGTGQVTPRVLDGLGCDVETLNERRDGRFPGRPSEPTAETCETLRAVVGTTDADLGVAHDGDADRMVAVADDGEFVPKDVLLALFARDAAGRGDRVAVPVDTSRVVADAAASVGASVTYTRVGDVFVAERATESDVVFGGEPSGAWIWPAETLCPDGPLAALRLVEIVEGRGPLSSLVETVDPYPIGRASVETDAKAETVDRVASAVDADDDAVTAVDGVRVDLDDGWFLVRASGTQPLVRVTAEADDPDRASALLAEARDLVEDARSEI